ncbi:MAG: DUF2461 domain-containing protein [Anaerolineae bacterium]
MPQSLKTTLDFLDELRFNNHKTWFDENRKRYQQARAAFETLISEVMQRFETVDDLGSTTVADCMFRINRDVRFSKDKSPYKTQMGALIANGGRKASGRSYYVHIDPTGSFLAGGAYAPSPPQLLAIRRHIANHPSEFNDILADKDFVRYFGTMQGEKLKTTPKGFEADHPALELLKYKQFLASHALREAQVLSDDLVPHIIDVFRAMKPFVGFLADALG